MKNNIKKTIFTFICVGFSVALFQYGIFYLLFEQFKNGYLVASSISFCLTVLVSYYLQKRFTFGYQKMNKNSKEKILSFALFTLNSVWGIILNGWIMYVGIDVFMVSPYAVQCVSMGMLAGYNFFVYRMLLG
jgi:putative flippase GtrA